MIKEYSNYYISIRTDIRTSLSQDDYKAITTHFNNK